jgi:predicted deacylase
MAYTSMSEVVSRIDAWVDLHGGDIPEGLVPFAGYIEAGDLSVAERSRVLAAAFGIEYVVRPSHLSGMTIGVVAVLNILALLAEAGQFGVLGEENTQLLLRGCWSVVRYLGILLGEVSVIALKGFGSWSWVRVSRSGCWHLACVG